MKLVYFQRRVKVYVAQVKSCLFDKTTTPPPPTEREGRVLIYSILCFLLVNVARSFLSKDHGDNDKMQLNVFNLREEKLNWSDISEFSFYGKFKNFLQAKRFLSLEREGRPAILAGAEEF